MSDVKIRELARACQEKIGHINTNGVKSEPNEIATFRYLTLFGFNIELIKPTSTEKAKNADILIMGSIWEVKTPISSSRSTIKARFRKASKQSTRVIFDLRFVKDDSDKVQKQIVEMFNMGGQVRHLMIIEKDGKLLDFCK